MLYVLDGGQTVKAGRSYCWDLFENRAVEYLVVVTKEANMNLGAKALACMIDLAQDFFVIGDDRENWILGVSLPLGMTSARISPSIIDGFDRSIWGVLVGGWVVDVVDDHGLDGDGFRLEF